MLGLLILFLCFVILDPWKIIKSDPPPAQKSEAPVPLRPDFSEIKIKDRMRPIHNAVVKEIRKDGLIFLADEGLIQARFKDLAPEFTKYYLYLATLRRQKNAPMLTSEISTDGPAVGQKSGDVPVPASPRS